MIDYDVSLDDVCSSPPGKEKAAQLAVYGLMTDGGHHKQWYLEQILLALDEPVAEIKEWLDAAGYGQWEEGIAP